MESELKCTVNGVVHFIEDSEDEPEDSEGEEEEQNQGVAVRPASYSAACARPAMEVMTHNAEVRETIGMATATLLRKGSRASGSAAVMALAKVVEELSMKRTHGE